jgi:hypothetical protein
MEVSLGRASANRAEWRGWRRAALFGATAILAAQVHAVACTRADFEHK